MNTAAVLRAWTAVEPALRIAEKVGMDRGMMSRHVNGHSSISAKHLASYLQVAPPDIRANLLGAWLLDNIPAELHAELLGRDGEPAESVTSFQPVSDPKIQRLLRYLDSKSASDPETRSSLWTFGKWMGYEDEPQADAPTAEHKRTTATTPSELTA